MEVGSSYSKKLENEVWQFNLTNRCSDWLRKTTAKDYCWCICRMCDPSGVALKDTTGFELVWSAGGTKVARWTIIDYHLFRLLRPMFALAACAQQKLSDSDQQRQPFWNIFRGTICTGLLRALWRWGWHHLNQTRHHWKNLRPGSMQSASP